MATDYGLDGVGIRGLIPSGGRNFSHLYSVQIDPAFSPMGTEGSFAKGKAARA
jgi:hypothetical protein